MIFQPIAGAFHYRISKRWAVAPRLEWFHDRDGFYTGMAQNLREASGTLEYKMTDWALFRFEGRRDQSDKTYFDKHDGSATAKCMNTLLAAQLVYWGPKK